MCIPRLLVVISPPCILFNNCVILTNILCTFLPFSLRASRTVQNWLTSHCPIFSRQRISATMLIVYAPLLVNQTNYIFNLQITWEGQTVWLPKGCWQAWKSDIIVPLRPLIHPALSFLGSKSSPVASYQSLTSCVMCVLTLVRKSGHPQQAEHSVINTLRLNMPVRR